MSGSASLGLEQQLLEHTLGITPMPTVGQVFVALCALSPPPTETTSGVEVAGGGYARQAATFALLTTPANAASNTATIEFPAALASWGTVGWFELWNAASGGTRLYWGELTDPADDNVPITLSVAAGDIVRFSAGTLTVQTLNISAIIGSIATTVLVADAPPANAVDDTLWWDSAGTGLYVRYNDGSSTQWVVAQNQNTLSDAPSDANTYGRHAGTWIPVGVGTNVKAPPFNAKGDGVTDDTAAIQAAANAVPTNGGVLLLPPGVYVVNTAILVPSNTWVQGHAATLLANATGFPSTGALLSNQHNTATVLTDHDIAVDGLTFDFGSSGVAGSAHAVRFVCVRNVTVENCTFQCRGAGNATAMIGCYDTLTDGCIAYGFINCGYDHWQSPSYARVVGCHAESASSAQMVNFNPEGVSGAAAKGFVLADCTLVCTGAMSIATQIEPLASGTIVSDVTVTGNTFVNSHLSMRGAVTGANVSDNVFDGVLGGTEVIRTYPAYGGNPVGFTIVGNTIINPATVAGNLAVIRVYTNSATIVGNVVSGALSGGVSAIDVSSFTPIVLGNSLSGSIAGSPSAGAGVPIPSSTTPVMNGSATAGTGTTYARADHVHASDTSRLPLTGGTLSGPLTVTGGAITANGGFTANAGAAIIGGLFLGSVTSGGPTDLSHHLNLYSNQAGISVTSDTNINYVGFTTHAFFAGATLAATISPSALTATNAVQVGSGGPTWTTGSAAPASTQPVGSLYSRVGGAVGATLYVSRGAGTWAAVAGV